MSHCLTSCAYVDVLDKSIMDHQCFMSSFRARVHALLMYAYAEVAIDGRLLVACLA